MGTPVPADDLPSGTAVPDDDLPGASAAPQTDAYGMPGGDIGPGQLFGDMGKSLIGGIVHGAGNLADVFTGTAPGPESHASRWAAPFAITDRLGQLDPDQQLVHQAVNRGYDKAFGTGPLAQTVKERIPEATEAIGTVVPLIQGFGGLVSPSLGASQTAEDVVNRMAQESPQSQGAAAAAPRVGQTSPELRQAIVSAAQKTGGAVNPDALARHVEADTLPVPIQLTEGQALQDPVRLSVEQNMRGQQTALSDRFSAQNGQLKQNLQAIRDEAGPDVFSANPVEHGDTLINAYKAKDAAAQADIKAKYQALADANGGDLPVDGEAFVNAADAALKKQMKAPFLPAPVQSVLQGLRDGGPMTMENFENLRTTLAAEGRKADRAGDGNAEAAISTVRDALENVPMQAGSAQIKALADSARSAAKARFDMLRDDPAYKAAVNDSVAPDRFVQKFVIGAPRDQVALMKSNLADNPVAQQTMGVATVDHLRRSAGVDDMGNGNFSQANYNKQLQALGPKIRQLVSPSTAETLEQLGNVARYTQAQPRGSFVNNSNTLVGSLAEHGAGVLEHIANAKTGGIGGTLVRGALNKRAAQAAAQRALAPGAGLDVLNSP